MITLVIEAATYAGSAALLRDGVLAAERSVAMRGREHEALMPAVAELLDEQGIRPTSLDLVVCGAGPGSFTSLRIGGAIAKGLALAAACPLVPVSSLALLVGSGEPRSTGRYLAAIDALRGEHYVALFEITPDGAVKALGPEGRVATPELESYSAGLNASLLVADAMNVAGLHPHASAAARLGSLLERTPPADLARWEPAYGRLAEAQVKWEAEHGRSLEVV